MVKFRLGACLPYTYILGCSILFASCAMLKPTRLNNSVLTTVTAKKVTVNWRFKNKDATNGLFKPAVWNKQVFIASTNGEIHILDIDSGKLISSFDLGQTLVSGIAVNNQYMFVVANDYKLLAIDNRTHKVIWQTKLDNAIGQAPIITNDKIIIYTIDGLTKAYSLDDGALLWVYAPYINGNDELNLRSFNRLQLIDSDSLAINLNDGSLNVINTHSGELIWTKPAKNLATGILAVDKIVNIMGPVALSNNSICFSNYLHQLSCVNKNNGNELWTNKFLAYSNVLLKYKKLYVLSKEGTLFAFDLDSGLVLWHNNILMGHTKALSSIRFFAGFIIVIEADGYIDLFDPYDGELIAHQASNVTGGSILYDIESDLLLVNSGNGYLNRISSTN